jgi:outer membrane receptor protein involved in Fe transport
MKMKNLTRQKKTTGGIDKGSIDQGIYWGVIAVVALACGSRVSGQTNITVIAGSSTNAVAATGTNVTELGHLTVIGKLNQARSSILPNLGATAYTHTAEQITMQSQGDNAPFNQVILRSPGVAQDSAVNGDLHVRGEHANLQYRIDDVLLPEGISGFGLELDPRFVQNMQLITGSLPAQYGFRTAGVVDIQTKTGLYENGGGVDIYGGSFNTIHPSLEYGGSSGKWDYFVDGSYTHNSLGIENPTASHAAVHDDTDQFRTFASASHVIDDTSRITFMGSASYSNFEVPNTPGLSAGAATNGTPWNVPGSGLPTTFNSSDLNEQQREQNYYGVAAYQKSVGDFNGQVSVFGRASGVHFRPDEIGDLYFNGVASDVERDLYSGGLQADGSYELSDHNTLRGGAQLVDEVVFADTATTVFPFTGGVPNGQPYETLVDNSRLTGLFSGLYLQDEWKFFDKITLNYGARFDDYTSSFDSEYQLSPRVNVIYQPLDGTTLHVGYSRYFTPPPVENVPSGTVSLFNGTSNASLVQEDTGVKAERANYYDAGISQQITPHFKLGVDGYYKTAHNQLDDGLFGQSLILSAFNYARGRIYGLETTGSFTWGRFAAYANVAWSTAQGEGAASAQFLWPDQGTLNYVNSHWIYLDHDQRVTGTFGVAYTLQASTRQLTRVYMDALYGSGLRADGGGVIGGAVDAADPIPNGGSIPAYYSINVGMEQDFKLKQKELVKARLDVVNLTDNIYELRNGTGVGVNAAQYGARLGFFGSLSYVF